MVVRIIEAQYDIEGNRYLVVYAGDVRRNGFCVIASKRKERKLEEIHKVEIYKLGNGDKIGNMEIAGGELSNSEEFGKTLSNFLKNNSKL